MIAKDPSRYVRQNVDQVGSVKLLGLAIIGGALSLLANWVVFG